MKDPNNPARDDVIHHYEFVFQRTCQGNQSAPEEVEDDSEVERVDDR